MVFAELCMSDNVSRTTIASSINRPILSDRANSVIMLMLNPNAQMNVNVPSRVIGKVKPVITVERKEPKNSKTIKTAKTAPSIWYEQRL